MATIKPTITLTANASGATKSPGPLSMALSLSATDSLTVDRVHSETKVLGTAVVAVLDGSALLATDSDAGTPGTHGGFLYLKNSSSTDLDIYCAFAADGDTSELGSNDDADRHFTLKQNEFAWVPWDYTGDFIARGEAADCLLEYWLFNRSI